MGWWSGQRSADVVTVVFLTLTAAFASALRLPVVLFPELAALTFIVMTKPEGRWARDPLKLVLTPSLAGLLGLFVTLHMAYGLGSIIIVVVGSTIILRIVRSEVVPALSAALLPLAFGITTWSYPAALVVVLSALALVGAVQRRLLRLFRMPVDAPADKGATAPTLQSLVFFALLVVVAYVGVLVTGMRLVLYPPLVVAAYQMLVLTHRCSWAQRRGRLVAACTATAIIGYLAFRLLGHHAVTVAVAVSAAIFVVRWLDLMVPPALAVALIPWLIASPGVAYPLAISFGTILLAIVSLLQSRFEHPDS